jgi:DNA repair protein RadD
MSHISARVCINCGEEFSFEVKITPNASTAELIVRDEPQVETFDVQRVEYAAHNVGRPGAIPSLKVSYYCGVRRFSEWVCLEHYGNPIQHKAHAWWRERSPWDPPPTITDAIAYLGAAKDPLCAPQRIRVWVNKKHPEILGYEF